MYLFSTLGSVHDCHDQAEARFSENQVIVETSEEERLDGLGASRKDELLV